MLKITEPLKVHLGIDIFWHYSLDRDGSFSYIGNCLDNASYHFEGDVSRENDFFVHPDALVTSYHLYADDPARVSGHRAMVEQFPKYHPLMTIRKDANGKLHGFGFASTLPRPKLMSLYMTRQPLIEHFIDHFLRETEALRKGMAEASVNMIELRSERFLQIEKVTNSTVFDGDPHKEFLLQTGFCPLLLDAVGLLSPREREVLRAVTGGQTAQETGQRLFISRRTVEHHLETIKGKLYAESKSEHRMLAKLLLDFQLI